MCIGRRWKTEKRFLGIVPQTKIRGNVANLPVFTDFACRTCGMKCKYADGLHTCSSAISSSCFAAAAAITSACPLGVPTFLVVSLSTAGVRPSISLSVPCTQSSRVNATTKRQQKPRAESKNPLVSAAWPYGHQKWPKRS